MSGDSDMGEMARRSMLPEPCTLVFGVPREAPAPTDDAGRQWTVEHWIHCGRRSGHTATARPDSGAEPRTTYCGDIDLDGLTYQVHRGPRKRILVQYGSTAERFELEESVWVEPIAPEPLPDDCPWCDLGPPTTLRHAGEADTGGVYVVGVSEHADGAGRVITFQLDLDEPDEQDVGHGFDTYCMVLDPGRHTIYRGITECVIEDQTLRLRLSPDAADDLRVDQDLGFHLDLDTDQLALLRAGLHRVLSAGRPDARPSLLRL